MISLKIRNNTFIRTIVFIILISLFIAFGFITGFRIKFYSEIFSLIIFTCAYLLTPSLKVDTINLVSPRNLMLLIFFTRLVICPLTIILFGYQPWVLPEMPDSKLIFKASVISDLAFLSFVIGWDLINETGSSSTEKKPSKFRFRNNGIIASGLLIALLIFIIFYYGSFSYYFHTLFMEDYFGVQEEMGRLWIYSNILFKYVIPFFGIILGIYTLEKIRIGIWGKAFIAFIFILLIIFLALGPSRNNIVFPVLAFLAAIIPRYFRIRFRDFVLGCIGFIILAFLFQNIRKRSNEAIMTELNTGEKFIEFIQVYFVAPHIMTPMFNIEGKFDDVPFTIHSSFLETIPVFGTPFREKSGSFFYNAGYEREGARDQVFPTYGELVMNLGYAGMIVVFILTGFFYRKIDIFFRRKTPGDPLFRAIIFYFTLLYNSLIFLSYSVFGQFIFYNSVLIFIVMLLRDRPVYENHI
ncbi:MAG: O-antigen polysaccharide polymerase Wzy [Bacteroidales bacterium]|nr:O-antigen polysaccharide polymerase Wzy [Bacteroidales bacterium]MBN2633804.1 O-antigen polysaccharide polymerase Wzy [Bacteroidales bacterium]